MNVILILSDTFRRDHLGCYGAEWIETPNLDALAKRSVVFDRAYLASFPTVPMRGDVMTGQFSFTRRGWEPLPRGVPTVAEQLKKAGYVSMLISDTPHHLKDGFFYQRGFTAWDWIRGQETDRLVTDPIPVQLPIEAKKLRTDYDPNLIQHLRNVALLRQSEEDCFVAQTMRRAIQWLERNHTHEKFFLCVDTFDPHEPWDAPRWYVDLYDDPGYDGPEPIYPYYGLNRLTERETQRARALYAGEVTLVDTWIGRLIDAIVRLRLWYKTLVIFTTDHGFLHGEHGLMGKGLAMYEEVAHVPLLIHLPGVDDGWRSDALVQPPDLAATLLDVAGVEPPETCEGQSLLPLLRRETKTHRHLAVSATHLSAGPPVRGHGSITDGEWTLLFYAERPLSELYYLPEDPRQEANRFEGEPEVVRRLYGGFLDFLRERGAAQEVVAHFAQKR